MNLKWFEKGLNFDRWLLAVVLILCFFGLVMVYSTSTILAMDKYNDPYFFLRRHIIWLFLGLGMMLVMMHLNAERIRIFSGLGLILAVGLLISVFYLPPIKKVHRWIDLGPFLFQPSEFARLALVIYLSHSLAKRKDRPIEFLRHTLPNFLVIGIIAGLVFLEPDLGGAITIGLVGMVLLYIGGVRKTHLGLALVSGLAGAVYSVLKEDYQWARIKAFIDPWQFADNLGYQLAQSFLAFGSGGLFGVGLGMSHQKLYFLPDAHTDFILSVIGEEWGLIGVMGVILIFGIFITRGMTIALLSPDQYKCNLALGLTAMIGLPALVNMAVVTGLAPTKGLVLPFLSYGGSALVINMVAVGILLNVSAKRFQR